jgi:hypothetical protein
MPCLEGEYQAWQGPIIELRFLAAGDKSPAHVAAAPAYPALIDTGADTSCISPAIVAALQLDPIGIRPMVTVLQVEAAHLYAVEIIVKFGASEYWQTLESVAEFRVDDQHYVQALLGRDILRRGAFVLSSGGHYTLCL